MATSKHIELTEERQSVVQRSSNFAPKCKRGCLNVALKQIHHILPCSTVNNRKTDYSEGKEDYIEDCLWVTPWDINDEPNLIGLPLKRQYRASGGRNPFNLPCHDVDHPKYNEEVRSWLKTNLWNTLNTKQKVHRVDVETILNELENGQTFHRDLLQARGGREGGIHHCWVNRHAPAVIEVWYQPFSMAEDPVPRHPPGAKGVLSKLKKCF